ncbi:MAG: DNA polymerase III subunit gamma/tau [Rickettsiales bacterium]
MLFDFSEEDKQNNSEYRVLARKYRPQRFADMIGQDVLVRTIVNAIRSGRIAHAFVLTGIRGIGKTTTARIIAKALNCTGQSPESVEPCGKCDNCVAISDDRHQDVLEMDAASHTGVNDIREIIDNVKYRPISAKYKIFIIDEVHMLSNSAFNALLKTLEEPPAHVKFIFATTEIRKIPITILSRCQRFDLRRIEIEELANFYNNVCKKENFAIEANALKLIASAASGSVRDGLSILDQAMSLTEGGHISEATVREMLGLVDSERVFKLFEQIVKGEVAEATATAKEIYNMGGDPTTLVQDLMKVVNHTARYQQLSQDFAELTEAEMNNVKEFAGKISVQFLSRLWQMLLKGLEELKMAVQPFPALEMLIIRIAYASTLPSLEEMIKNAPQNDNKQTSVSEKKIAN